MSTYSRKWPIDTADMAELLFQLRHWGYEPETMLATNFSKRGFHRISVDDSGGRIVSSQTGTLVTTLEPWKKLDHFYWLIGHGAVEDLPEFEVRFVLRNGEIVLPEKDLVYLIERVKEAKDWDGK